MPHRVPKEASEQEIATYERLFYDQMLIYRSHWRDDPTFDLTNTARALPHLPCPEMDYDLLMRVARYPIEKNFGLSKYEAVERPIDVQKRLDRFLGRPAGDGNGRQCVALQVNGGGGGQWHLFVRDGAIVGGDLGLGLRRRSPLLSQFGDLRRVGRRPDDSRAIDQCGPGGAARPRGVQQHLIRVLEQLVSTS